MLHLKCAKVVQYIHTSIARDKSGSRVRRWQINQQITWRNKLKAGQQIKPDRRQFPLCNWHCHGGRGWPEYSDVGSHGVKCEWRHIGRAVSWGLVGCGVIKCQMYDKTRRPGCLKAPRAQTQDHFQTQTQTQTQTHSHSHIVGSFRASNWMHSGKRMMYRMAEMGDPTRGSVPRALVSLILSLPGHYLVP